MATIVIDQGKLKGSRCYTDKGTEYYEFLGIPYAKPPVGDLRFRAPQAPEKWDGIRDATTINQCQISCQRDTKRNLIGSEDCLYLSVFKPCLPNITNTNGEPKLLPVMVHIHGGGFLRGNGIIKADVGPEFLIDNHVIFVSMNYRLGIFGFLSLDIPEASGNMALKDILQALIWVQNNIEKFGGDKNNVTIFGYSAGSVLAEFILLSSKSRGLFHKAILQSGSTLNNWAINYNPEKLIKRCLERLGYNGPMKCQKTIHQYLLSYPAPQLTEESFKAVKECASGRVYFGFVPTIEKDFGNNEAFIITNPYNLLKDGQFIRVPVIIGFCEKEGHMMTLCNSAAIAELNENKNFLQYWAYSLETNDLTKYNMELVNVYKSYHISNDEEDMGVDFFGDYDFISGIWISGQFMADQGVPVYFYKFCYDGNINYVKKSFNMNKKGATHADDIAYVYNTKFSEMAEECDIIIQNKMTKMWANFAKTSDPVPECSDLMPWPIFSRNSPVYLKIDKEFAIEFDYEPAKMKIFAEIYEKYKK